MQFIWWQGEKGKDEVVHICKDGIDLGDYKQTHCGRGGMFWEKVPTTVLQRGTKNCPQCWQEAMKTLESKEKKMYTPEEVQSLCRVFDEYQQRESKLFLFCEEVAKALDFDSVLNVGIQDVHGKCPYHIYFRAEWHGPYQSEDQESFYFPADLLAQGEEAVVAYLKKEREEQQSEKHAQSQAQREQEERKLLATLKEKYE